LPDRSIPPRNLGTSHAQSWQPCPIQQACNLSRDGEAWLKALTKHYIDQIIFPPDLNATGNENAREAIKQVIDDTAFAHQNILGAVEQKCTWIATRNDGQRIFELVVNFSKSSLFDLKLMLC
jgi:hypothetical protein